MIWMNVFYRGCKLWFQLRNVFVMESLGGDVRCKLVVFVMFVEKNSETLYSSRSTSLF